MSRTDLRASHGLFYVIFTAIFQGQYTHYLGYYKLENGGPERLAGFLHITHELAVESEFKSRETHSLVFTSNCYPVQPYK